MKSLPMASMGLTACIGAALAFTAFIWCVRFAIDAWQTRCYLESLFFGVISAVTLLITLILAVIAYGALVIGGGR